jgi:hypothetical protein
VKDKKPVLVFLMETKLMQQKADFLTKKLGFENIFVVDCKGRSGGLILLWKSDLSVEIHNYSRRHVNAIIKKNKNAGASWKFIGFYGNPESDKRMESWSLLRYLSSFHPSPWLCLGDFNEITSSLEKYSLAVRPRSQMRNFQAALEDCNLLDLGFTGPTFTWTNGRSGCELSLERLDRAVANPEWCQLFDAVDVQVLPRCFSDHNPLLVSISNSQHVKWRKSRQFRFEASWVAHKEHKPLIKQVWRVKAPVRDKWRMIISKLEGCRKSLQHWARRQGDQVEGKIQDKLKNLQALQQLSEPSKAEEEKVLKDELNILLEEEDLKWCQRSKENWLRNGDRNTKYFHACASQRNRRNQIQQILNHEGRQCTTQQEIEGAFIDYFQGLFTAGTVLEVEQSTRFIEKRVTPSMNQELTAVVSMEEITAALHQMAPLKAPGPDGFPACFYQNNWDIVHNEVCDVILYFFETREMDEKLNSTNIALIPKNSNPCSVSDFRPISLCNVLYKLISKILANRLKKVLPSIISSTQSAFIPRRLITDNILAAYETMHTMQNNMWSKTGYMGLKLDMSKAYDRVKWPFLEVVMCKLDFEEGWIKMIMSCVRTVKWSVLVNGNGVGHIRPSRGIRQGDPISPYLFLICTEALSSLLKHAEHTEAISAVPTSRRGPKLSHLFFADDSLIFCKANQVEWWRIMRVLGVYEAGSGQKINFQKTAVFFSRNTCPSRRQEILSLSGLSEATRYDSYLGLPTLIGKSRTQSFNSIKD